MIQALFALIISAGFVENHVGEDRSTCPNGQSDCSGSCSTLSTDSANCGACGVVCTNSQTCMSGACVTRGRPGFSCSTMAATLGANFPNYSFCADGTTLANQRGLLGNGTTTSCTALETPVPVLSPFCRAGVTPNSCTTTMHMAVHNVTANDITFASTGNPGTGSMTACTLTSVASSAQQLVGTDNVGQYGVAGHPFWGIRDNGATHRCDILLQDTTPHSANANPATDNGNAFNLCCFALTAGTSFRIVFNGVDQGTTATTTVGSLTSANPLTVSGPGTTFVGDYAGLWVWLGDALTLAQMQAVNTQILATGPAATFPALVNKQPAFWWSPSLPLENSITPSRAPIGTAITSWQPGAPFCSSINNGVNAGCLTAQQFDGGQSFDCGATVGDPGSGTSSPANDFSVCYVGKGLVDASNSALELLAVDKFLSNVGYNMGTQGGLVSTSPGTSVLPTDSIFESSASLGGTGSFGVLFDDWVVNCGTFQANGIANQQYACPYQNGVLGTSPDGYQVCDNWSLADQHNTVHFGIGNHIGGSATNAWNGQILGVWFWNQQLTVAQVAAFAAPWKAGNVSSSSPYCQIIGSNWECFSSGM